MTPSEPIVGGLEPTPIRQGGPPARAVIGVFAIGLVAVIGIGVFGQSPAPTPPPPTAAASIAAVSTPSISITPPTPTPAPTLREGGCETGLAPIAGEIPAIPDRCSHHRSTASRPLADCPTRSWPLATPFGRSALVA